VIELPDSGVYVPKLRRIELPPGHTLQIRAAERARPVLRLLDNQTEGPDLLTVALAPGSRFTLDGLWISGRGVYAESWQSEQEEPEGSQSDDQLEDQNQVSQPAQSGTNKKPPPKPGPQSGLQSDPIKECCGEDQPPTLPPPRLVIRHCTLVPGWLLDSDASHAARPSPVW